MTTCARCSAALGVGRFCTNCGHRVGADLPPEPTSADPTAAEPTTPRPVHEAPPPARFPLWADATGEDAAVPPAPPRPAGAEDAPTATIPVVASTPAPRPGGSQTALVLAVVAVVVVLALAAGAILLVRGGGSDEAATDPTPPAPTPSAPPSSPSAPDTSPRASTSSEPMRLAGIAGISAPQAGPTSADVATGQPITYVAQNMLDGDPATCWRTPGDAGGREIVLRLPSATTLVEVGLINGYAKTSKADGRTYDWYHGNRRVLSVEWIFDDGTRLTQDLRDTRSLQRLDVEGVKTTTVRLRLLSVSPPGTGPAGKDNTAISEISLLGTAPRG